MDKSDLQTAIRQKLQLQETNEFKQSAYYKRFEELHITEGTGKLLELFGKSRAIDNQNAIGITTTPTLREILRLRAEHIWEFILFARIVCGRCYKAVNKPSSLNIQHE
jgi:hypothetical protein